MKTRGLMATAVAVSIAVAGCAPTITGTRPPGTMAKTGATFPLGACGPNVPKPPTGTQPYIITLGPSFELRNAVVGKSGHAQGANPAPHNHKTTLDIVTQISGANSATIQIVLADSKLHFMDKALALMGSTSNSQTVFCDVTMDTAADPRWLSFTVYPVGSNTSASYNLGLLADDHGNPGFQLPFIIDPWADNNGMVLQQR